MKGTLQGIRRMELFAGLSDVELEQVLAMGEHVAFKEGALIFREGDPGDAFYGIVSGTVRIGKGRGSHAQFQRFLAMLGAGEVFGEMTLLDEKPRSAGALAASSCELFRLPRAAFEALLEKRDATAWKLLRNLARTLSGRIRRIDEGLTGLQQRAEEGGVSTTDLKEVLERFSHAVAI